MSNLNTILERVEKQLSSTSYNEYNRFSDINILKETKLKYSIGNADYEYENDDKRGSLLKVAPSNCNLNFQIRNMIEKELETYVYTTKQELQSIMSSFIRDNINNIKETQLEISNKLEENKNRLNSHIQETSNSITNLNVNSHSNFKAIEQIKEEIKERKDLYNKFDIQANSLREEMINLQQLNSNSLFNKESYNNIKKDILSVIDDNYTNKIKSLENNITLIKQQYSNLLITTLDKEEFNSFKLKQNEINNEELINKSNILFQIKKTNKEQENLAEKIKEFDSLLMTNKTNQNKEEINFKETHIQINSHIENIFNKLKNEIYGFKLSTDSRLSTMEEKYKLLYEDVYVFRNSINNKEDINNDKINNLLSKFIQYDHDSKTINEILNKLYDKHEEDNIRNKELLIKMNMKVKKCFDNTFNSKEDLITLIKENDSSRDKLIKQIKNDFNNFTKENYEKVKLVTDYFDNFKTPVEEYLKDKDIMNDIAFKLKDEIDYIKNEIQIANLDINLNKENTKELVLKLGQDSNLFSNLQNKIIKISESCNDFNNRLDELALNLQISEINNKSIRETISEIELALNTNVTINNHFLKRPLDPRSKEKYKAHNN